MNNLLILIMQQSIVYYHCPSHFPSAQVIHYNRLLTVVHSTLKDLLKTLKGLVVMSQALETMFNSLYNNTVPELWAIKVGGGGGGGGDTSVVIRVSGHTGFHMGVEGDVEGGAGILPPSYPIIY